MANERLKQFAKKLNSFSLIDVIEEALSELEDDIIEIQQQQLQRGEKSDGSFMPKYSPKTLAKRDVISSNGLIALYDTGDFWGSMRSESKMGLLKIEADDWKTEMLIEYYGEQILGLNKVSLDRLKEISLPIIRAKTIKILKV